MIIKFLLNSMNKGRYIFNNIYMFTDEINLNFIKILNIKSLILIKSHNTFQMMLKCIFIIFVTLFPLSK